jgi:hypothetical protein
LVVAVGITVLVLGFLATAVVQFFDVTRWGNDRLVIDSDFQTAALWLGRDAGEANAFNPGSGTTYGILRWPDGSNQYRYSYSAADTALVREHILGGSVLSNLQVAKHIAAQGDVTFTSSAGLLTVTLTATSGAVSQTVEFKFDMRAQ